MLIISLKCQSSSRSVSQGPGADSQILRILYVESGETHLKHWLPRCYNGDARFESMHEGMTTPLFGGRSLRTTETHGVA